jgi:ribosomal protein S18 acetylase RimI-like enzyme
MKYTIRPATPQDLEPMLEWRGHSHVMRAALQAEFAKHAQGQRTILIAFDSHGNQVGTIQLVRDHHDPDLVDARSAYLQALDVHDGHRGCGVGTALIGALESHAKASGCSRVTLMVEPDNAPALALYTKLGFRAFKEAVDVWDGRTYPVVCLEKDLDGDEAQGVT